MSCQMLSELEEVIQYKLVPERRDIIRETWWERLQVTARHDTCAHTHTYTHSLFFLHSLTFSLTCATVSAKQMFERLLLLMGNITDWCHASVHRRTPINQAVRIH